jgi:hypothetical protein
MPSVIQRALPIEISASLAAHRLTSYSVPVRRSPRAIRLDAISDVDPRLRPGDTLGVVKAPHVRHWM